MSLRLSIANILMFSMLIKQVLQHITNVLGELCDLTISRRWENFQSPSIPEMRVGACQLPQDLLYYTNLDDPYAVSTNDLSFGPFEVI